MRHSHKSMGAMVRWPFAIFLRALAISAGGVAQISGKSVVLQWLGSLPFRGHTAFGPLLRICQCSTSAPPKLLDNCRHGHTRPSRVLFSQALLTQGSRAETMEWKAGGVATAAEPAAPSSSSVIRSIRWAREVAVAMASARLPRTLSCSARRRRV